MGVDCGPSPKRDYPGPWTVNAGGDPNDHEAEARAQAHNHAKIAEWDKAEDLRIQRHMLAIEMKREVDALKSIIRDKVPDAKDKHQGIPWWITTFTCFAFGYTLGTVIGLVLRGILYLRG